jgi:hypothetical protein
MSADERRELLPVRAIAGPTSDGDGLPAVPSAAATPRRMAPREAGDQFATVACSPSLSLCNDAAATVVSIACDNATYRAQREGRYQFGEMVGMPSGSATCSSGVLTGM